MASPNSKSQPGKAKTGSVFPACDSCVGDIPPKAGYGYGYGSSGQRLPVSFEAGDLIFFRGHDWLSRGISYQTCTCGQLLRSPFNGGLFSGGFLPSHVAELAGPWFARRLNEAPAENSWFCDELCIEALKTMGRVSPDDDPEDFSPATFAKLMLHSGAYWPINRKVKEKIA